MNGTWMWHELNTPDVHRAQTFYGHLFGWGVTEMPLPGGMYYLFQKDGQGHAGLIQTGGPGLENEPTRWLVYLATDDVDRDHARIADLGGKALTHVMEVPGTGRWFLAEDPAGAQFALMQPYPRPEAARPVKAAKPKAKPKPAVKGKASAKPAPKPAKPAKAVKPLAKRSPKAKPMKAAIKKAKKTPGLKAGTRAKRDLAAAKARDAALKGRSQRNMKR
ncbi:MAG: VOC family protein [Micropepsaceae bacterium]